MKAMFLVGLLVAATAGAAAQDQFDAAKNLYASAAYEEALSALARLSDDTAVPAARTREVDEYRAFCLFALGRTAEAETVAESIVRRDPLAALHAADASPRLEAMFTGVRKKVLPAVIRERYRTIRVLINEKQYAEAQPGLGELQLLLSSAEDLGAWDEGLGDLKVLVDGFLELSRARADSGTPEVATNGSSAPVVRDSASAPEPAPAPAVETQPETGPRLYSVEDADVTPPGVIYQRAPSVPAQLRSMLRVRMRPMFLLLTIDDTGAVKKAEVRGSLDTSYDDLLLREAATWKYTPARRQGTPVWFVKFVAIEVQ
jgi:hypothetical protein